MSLKIQFIRQITKRWHWPFPELLANVGDEVTPVDVVAERAGQPVPEVVAQLLELELAGWIAAVPGGYVRLRRHAMFDVLMYLFETYIHNEAELRVDQDKLERGSYRRWF